MSTSDDLVTSYLQAFDELRARKRWSTQSVTLRFVALGLVDVASTFGYDRLEQAARSAQAFRLVQPAQVGDGYVVADDSPATGWTRPTGACTRTASRRTRSRVAAGPDASAAARAARRGGSGARRNWNGWRSSTAADTDHRWLTNRLAGRALASQRSGRRPGRGRRSGHGLHDAGFRRGQQASSSRSSYRGPARNRHRGGAVLRCGRCA